MSLSDLTRAINRLARSQNKQRVQPPRRIVAKLKEYTIASGAITLTGYSKIRFIAVDTEGDASSDDLDTISGGTTGDILIIKTSSSARDVTAKDGTGNLYLAGDFLMDTSADYLTLIAYGTDFVEISRSNNQ